MGAVALPCIAGEPVSTSGTERTSVKLPGMEINLKQRYVDLDASVCLSDGYLELVACRKGSKEHESIVAVDARPMHIHTALLLLGANNGNPAMRKPTGDELAWVEVEPRGDEIEVSLVYHDADAITVERSVNDFIKHSVDGVDRGNPNLKLPEFAGKFLFAGSHLRDKDGGPREYLADTSGNIISIVTFGDELMCLSETQSHANGALSWRVDATHLPKVGTKIKLRLRPKNQSPLDAKKPTLEEKK